MVMGFKNESYPLTDSLIIIYQSNIEITFVCDFN